MSSLDSSGVAQNSAAGPASPENRAAQRVAGSPEHLAEVPEVRGRAVLDQAEQVGARRRQGPSDVVLTEPVQLPDQRLARPAQVAVQLFLHIQARHAIPPIGQGMMAVARRRTPEDPPVAPRATSPESRSHMSRTRRTARGCGVDMGRVRAVFGGTWRVAAGPATGTHTPGGMDGQPACTCARILRVELTLTGENGRSLRLSNVVRAGDQRIEMYEATLAVPGIGSATTSVHEYGSYLAPFFRELAEAWRGFDDVKTFVSLEGQLTIDARHDGRGSVYCDVCLGQPWPPEWTLSAVLDFGAGAHLESLADDVEGLLG